MEVFVPGRLCVLGEHTDWAANYRDINAHISYGVTVVCATNEGLHARCGVFEPELVKFTSSSTELFSGTIHKEKTLCLSLSDVAEVTDTAQGGGFFSYVAGTVLSLMAWDQQYADLLLKHGLYIDNYLTTLPMQKGLSSSAAVCVLVVSCFSVVHGLEISTRDVMEIAYRGETRTPSQCGRMDQCVAMGKDTIGAMTFTERGTLLRPLAVKTPLYFVVADLKAHKETVTILSSLNQCFPTPKNTTEFKMHDYVRLNHEIAWSSIRAIERGDVCSLAEAMLRAQQSFDDNLFDLCPLQFAAPALRKIFADPHLQDEQLFLAAKGVGSNGDGTVQFLCESSEKQTKLRDALNSQAYALDAFSLTIPATSAHSNIHPSRVPAAVIILPCVELMTDESIREFLLQLMSCGISAFALIIKSRNGGDVAAFDSREPGKDSSESWHYREAMGEVLDPLISCCLFCEEEDVSGSLLEATRLLLRNHTHLDADSSGFNFFCCEVSRRDESAGSSLDSPAPRHLRTASEFLLSFSFEAPPLLTAAAEESIALPGGCLVSTSRVLKVTCDLSSQHEVGVT